jgi:hypothetical protein
MVQLAAIQKKTVPSRQSSTSDDSDDDAPVKKGGKIWVFFIDRMQLKC